MENKKGKLKEVTIKNKESLISHQPWATYNEWKSCYDLLFTNAYNMQGKKIKKVDENLDSFINNLDLNNLIVASNLLGIWRVRNENPIVLTTALLVEEIIKVLQRRNNSVIDGNTNSEDNKHILSQKIIRVTNLIIDDLKKKNRNLKSNMFLVAKEIDFPEFIVEIRHACTHKNLPQESTLLFVIKYLYHWIKENIWDQQNSLHIKEIELSEKLISLIQDIKNLNTTSKLKKFDSRLTDLETFVNDSDLNLELENLFKLVEVLITELVKKINITNNVVLCENLNEFSKIYKFLQLVENKFFSILIFKFITQQLMYFIQGLIENHSNCFLYLKEKENILRSLCFVANFAVKFDIIKDNYKKNNYSNLIISIYRQLHFAKDFSSHIAEIHNFFSTLIKDVDIEADLIDSISTENLNKEIKLAFNKEEYLTDYKTGSLLFQQLDFLAANNDAEAKEFYKKSIQKSEEKKNNKAIADDVILEDYFDYENEIKNSLML